MASAEKVFLSLTFSFVIIGAVISRIDIQLFEEWYVTEDGLIEWLTVLALLSSAMISFYRAKILKNSRRPIFVASLIGVGLVFLFGVGEEISWGQRIFNFESTEFFRRSNTQGETNLHNLVLGGIKINKLVFGTLLGILIVFYLLILPVLYRKTDKINKLVDFFAIPVPKWSHTACFVLLVVISESIPGGKKWEILEFGGCWIFAMILLRPYNSDIFSPKSFDG
jgi:hypothetical protein